MLLAACRWPSLIEPHATALRRAVEFVLGETTPLGIIATGTVIRGHADPASDIDLSVLHDAPYRRRVQRFFEGVPTEIFINPPHAVRSYLVSEQRAGRRITAHMLATGFVVLDRDPIVEQLLAESHDWLVRPEVFAPDDAQRARYAAASLLEDGADVTPVDSAVAALILGRAVTQMLEYWLRSRGRPIPRTKALVGKAFAEALHNPAYTSRVAAVTNVSAAVPASRRFAVPALVAVAALTMVLAAWNWMRPNRPTPVARYATTLGAPGALDGLTFAVEAAISPDGASLVFRRPLTGPGQLYVKRRDEVVAQPLAGTEGGSGPFFSPDGAWIGFVANGQLRRIPSTGGASLKLADSVDATFNRGAWLEGGSIIYYDLTTHTLRRLDPTDGTSKVIVTTAKLGGRYPWLPSPLPAGRGFLFTAHLTNCTGPVSCRPSRVYLYDIQRDSIRELFDDAIGAWHVNTGHVLYLTSAGTLMVVPWDNKALAPGGPAVAVLDGIQAPGFLVSNEGTAYYLMGRPEVSPSPLPNAVVTWVDRTGKVEPVDSSWQVNTGGADSGPLISDWGLDLSPDGQRIALTQLTDLGTDLWIKQLPTGPATRLTLHPGKDQSPSWTPDGRAITFLSDRPVGTGSTPAANSFNVWQQDADGTSEPRLLWGKDDPTDAFGSPDGRWIVLGTTTSTGTLSRGEILAVQPGVDSVARKIVATGYDTRGAALSPDSRWLAYVSNEQGTNEVFVRPFPDVSGGKWQVSSGGGSAPVWARSGRELFFVANGKMQVVRINRGPPFSAASPRTLFVIPEGVRAGSLDQGTFAISPDDQRFLMVRDNSWGEMAGNPTLVVVQNFFEELRAKLKQ